MRASMIYIIYYSAVIYRCVLSKVTNLPIKNNLKAYLTRVVRYKSESQIAIPSARKHVLITRLQKFMMQFTL